jgi:hypothetical protein
LDLFKFEPNILRGNDDSAGQPLKAGRNQLLERFHFIELAAN